MIPFGVDHQFFSFLKLSTREVRTSSGSLSDPFLFLMVKLTFLRSVCNVKLVCGYKQNYYLRFHFLVHVRAVVVLNLVQHQHENRKCLERRYSCEALLQGGGLDPQVWTRTLRNLTGLCLKLSHVQPLVLVAVMLRHA